MYIGKSEVKENGYAKSLNRLLKYDIDILKNENTDKTYKNTDIEINCNYRVHGYG